MRGISMSRLTTSMSRLLILFLAIKGSGAVPTTSILGFSASLRERISRTIAESSTIYIAPGNYHMMVETSGAKRIIRIKDGPRMHGQRPAVDILFNSAAEKVGKNCIAVLMTGMGRDGAIGMKNVKEAGGYTIAQDEASSIVFGMPKEAIAIGGASEISSLDAIPQAIKKRI